MVCINKKMKVLVVDISGKVEFYDDSLVSSLQNQFKEDSIVLLRPGKGLLSLVPRKFKNSESIIKRLIKVIEGLLNYCYVFLRVIFCHVNILHLQWLPFMEVNGWEIPYLLLLKKISPNTKIVLTIHNIYPHNLQEKRKKKYNVRFRKACKYIDEFIVHTNISKNDVIREFEIHENIISVCCHGMFIPVGVEPQSTNRDGGKLHILQFGNQSYYKGTDILVEAVSKLNEKNQVKIDTRIIGNISPQFLEELQKKDTNGIISWVPRFLDDGELYEEINKCDLIVLPYRAISQSGVLLLSIFFSKLIICSNLPSFVETMRGNDGESLDNVLFFKSEDADSLRMLLEKYIENTIDEEKIKIRLDNLKKLYSWECAASSTYNVYKR